MKSIILISFILIIWTNVFCQSEIYLKSNENISSVLSAADPNSVGGRGFDYRYEGTKGTPNIFNAFKKGTILFANNTKVENVLINLDNYSNLTGFINPTNNDTLFVDNKTVHTIILSEDKTVYQKIIPSLFEQNVKDNSIFKILEATESFVVLKHDFVTLKKADYSGAYSADVRYDEFIRVDKYYVRIGEGNFVQVRPKKSNLIKSFPEKKEEISKFINQNKSLTEEELLVELFSKLYK